VKQVGQSKRAQPEPVGDAELREIERSTVLLAEIMAGVRHTTPEQVLSFVYDAAAITGRSPFEVLKRMRRREV
jgi:hypothetical protein